MTQQMPLQIESAQDYLDRLIRELRVMGSDRRQPLVAVLEYVLQLIKLTREEIGGLKSVEGAPLSSSADELEEIVTETARATNEIMGAAESVELVASTMQGRQRAALEAAATRIYVASSFQDITGQRITKVVRALQHIEARVEVLSLACGNVMRPKSEAAPAAMSDADLLNGPQLGRNAVTQSDIDSLFDSLDGAA